MFNSNLLFSLIDVLAVIVPVLMAIAFMTILERKQLAAHQRRVGPAKCIGNTLWWVKLSNSGELLKLMIPNYIWKFICGWTNYSCMVTSQKISEKKVDNRGSKSGFNMNSVKEQRVNGNWWIKLIYLRYTLMGFERNYRIKNPSKQLNVKKFSTFNSKSKMDPWFFQV